MKVDDSINTNGETDVETQPFMIDAATADVEQSDSSSSATTNNRNHRSSSLVYSVLYAILVGRLSRITVGSRGTPLLSGVDRVLNGVSSAADSVLLCGVRPPRYLWYMLSGAGCDVVQFATNVLLHRCYPGLSNTTCWTVVFTTSISYRHSAHRYLTFGNYVGGYWNSLGRMYGGYSFSIVLSAVFNWILTNAVFEKGSEVGHYMTYFFTMLWTGVVNYFILKRMWNFAGTTTTATTTTTTSANSVAANH